VNIVVSYSYNNNDNNYYYYYYYVDKSRRVDLIVAVRGSGKERREKEAGGIGMGQ
jgi:hypothetical protein